MHTELEEVHAQKPPIGLLHAPLDAEPESSKRGCNAPSYFNILQVGMRHTEEYSVLGQQSRTQRTRPQNLLGS